MCAPFSKAISTEAIAAVTQRFIAVVHEAKRCAYAFTVRHNFLRYTLQGRDETRQVFTDNKTGVNDCVTHKRSTVTVSLTLNKAEDLNRGCSMVCLSNTTRASSV